MEFLALDRTGWSAIVASVRAVKTLMVSAGEPLLGIVFGLEDRNKV